MADGLKAYASPWDGPVVLACKKCQRKLKGESALAKLSKAVKQSGGGLKVLSVGCMDVCPKGGVAVVDPRRVGKGLYILRGDEDVACLIESIVHKKS